MVSMVKKFKCSQCEISCVIASASSRHLPKRCPFVEKVYHDKCKWEEIKLTFDDMLVAARSEQIEKVAAAFKRKIRQNKTLKEELRDLLSNSPSTAYTEDCKW